MAEPSAVTPLEGHLGYWLNYVGSHVGLGFRRKLAGRGVTVAEWVVLRLLLGRGGEPPSQLAERMGMTRGAVSRLVERLVAKGLVSRAAGGGDRRFQALALTPAGEALVPELAALADRNDAEFFASLSAEERATVERVLRGLVARLGLKALPVD